jgi:spermidine/putrescine transport system permease protein
MSSAAEIAREAERKDIRTRWWLTAPALTIIFFAAAGPLLIVVVYSFLTPGNYGDVKWDFSLDAWIGVLLERDIRCLLPTRTFPCSGDPPSCPC